MKQLLFILFLFVILSSCTDNPLSDTTADREDVTYTYGELTLQLDNPAETTTRSSGWDYDDYFPNSDIYHNDSKNERWRHSICIAYFDSDFLLEQFNIPTITDLTGSSGAASDVYSPDKPTNDYTVFTLGMGDLTVTSGAHYFYSFANLPPKFMYYLRTYCNERKGILTKDEFEKTILTLEDEEYMVEDIAGFPIDAPAGDGGRMNKPRCAMTSATSPAPFYLAPYTWIVGSGSYPSVNVFTMKAGKAFAKVSVAYIPETANEQLSEVEYRIVNDPKHTYLLSNIFGGQVHTPHYDKKIVTNYSDYFTDYFNPNSHINKTFTDSTNFSWREATIDKDDKKNIAYCLENGNETPLQGNSTMVLIKAKYTPAQWLNPDDSPGNKNPEETFWRIKNKNGGYLAGYYNTEPPVGNSQEAVKYEHGYTYYPIWLVTNSRYMVSRNRFYKIAITEVLSAGAPDLASVMDPEKPMPDLINGTKSSNPETIQPEVAQSIRWKQSN